RASRPPLWAHTPERPAVPRRPRVVARARPARGRVLASRHLRSPRGRADRPVTVPARARRRFLRVPGPSPGTLPALPRRDGVSLAGAGARGRSRRPPHARPLRRGRRRRPGRAARILARCRAAMGAGARLLVVETLVPADGRPTVAQVHDLEMLVFTDGRERTAAEYRALLEASGFHLRRITPAAGGASVLEALPMPTRSPARR